eukprot:Anaeramoba_ignava/c19967_g2_i2.p1 GENE.c19967_g2_i2~~c19967_g2_i2.p1  ORF type:complete len:302 (+),score=2.11 c19967_g2_i2:2469-3374(+)
MRKILISLLLITLVYNLQSQELKCQVQILDRQIQRSDRSIFEEMQRTIYEFMNNTVFTNHTIKTAERIECSMVINLSEQTGSDTYKGTIQVTTTRPVYNSNYTTPLFNILDENLSFRFAPQEAIDFNINSYSSTLSSILTYYAYLILAYDYDTFGEFSGTEFYENADRVVANAQSDPSPGWRTFQADGKNRSAIIEEIKSEVYRPLRQTFYMYHRKGLDEMTDNKERARSNVLSALEKLRPLYRKRPESYLLQLFFEAKVDEIVDIFSAAPAQEKRRIFTLMNSIDPARSDKYRKIMQSND